MAPESLRPARRAGGRPTSDLRYGGGGGRGCQNRARYGSSGRRARQASPANARQVVSRFAASTADPDSFTTSPVPRIPRPMRRIARPDPLVQRVLTPMPQNSETHFGCHCVPPSPQGRCATVPRWACPAMTAASGSRVRQTVNPGTRISFDRTPAHCGRTPRPAGPACRSSDASVLTALMSAVEPQ